MLFKGAIFDLDGTLLDSMGVWDTVGDRFLMRRGITPPSDLRQILKPLGLEQAVVYLKRRYGFADSVSQLMQEANDLVEQDYRHHILLKPSVLPFLESLRKRQVSLCIATATDRHLVETALNRLGIDHYFPRLITCTEAGAGKDQPDIYFQALSLLGTTQADTIVFEDSLHAIQTAVAAGFLVAGVFDPSAKKDADAIRTAATWYLHSYPDFWEYHSG
ncbi:MAG: HAD family hydrolase [Oscillospiraceae bacterium]|jgi:HAD superfamily hydrolase (TIGR01509 family)